MSKISFPGGGGINKAITEIEGVDGPVVNLVEGSGIFMDIDTSTDTIIIHAAPTGGAAGGSAGVVSLNGISGLLTLVGSSGIQIATSGTDNIIIDQVAGIDQRAVTGDITMGTDGAYNFGIATARVGSGSFVLASGTLVSGINIGAATQMYVSGISIGDFLSPHTVELFTQQSGADLLPRASFAASGAAEKPVSSGTVVGAGTDLYVSGISVGDFLSPHTTDHGALGGLVPDNDHPQYSLTSDFVSSGEAQGWNLFTQQSGTDLLPRASFAASGAAEKPISSGTVVGAGTDLYVSGINVGNFLSPHTTDHGALGGLTDDDHTQYLLRSGFAASGISAQITMSGIAGATSGLTLAHMNSIFHSAGWVYGGGISDNGDGTVDVATGGGYIRAADSNLDALLAITWAASGSVPLTDLTQNYIYVEYNGGAPQVIGTNTKRTDFQTNILLGTVLSSGTSAHVEVEKRHVVGNHGNLMIRRMKDTVPFARVNGATIAAVASHSGITLTTGNFWEGLTEFSTPAFDNGASETHSSYYLLNGTWVEIPGMSGIDNLQYNDVSSLGSETLATLTNNRYGVAWIYLSTDGDVQFVYGQGDYLLAQANAALSPVSLPLLITEHSRLVGMAVIQKSATSLTEVTSAFTQTFATTQVTDHGQVGGLTDDDHTQYLLRSDFASSGAAEKPTTSGTVVGAGTDLYVSGIAVGDFLSAGGGNPVDARAATGDIDPNASGTLDLGSTSAPWRSVRALSGIFGSGTVTIDNDSISISGVNVLTGTNTSGANVGAGTQIYVSGLAVGDFLSAGGGNPIDGRAATGNLEIDTDAAYDIGALTATWGSGYFVEVSGTNLRAATQLYVSGVSVGNFLSEHPASIFTHESGLLLSDHGSIDGLTDDDHSQYLIGDYTRASNYGRVASGVVETGMVIGTTSGAFGTAGAYSLVVVGGTASGLLVRRSDGRTAIGTESFDSVLNVGGDGVISMLGTSPKIDSPGNLTFEDGGGGSFTNHATTSFRINNNDAGALLSVVTDSVSKDAVTIRAITAQTSHLLNFEGSGAGNPVVALIDIAGTISGTVTSGINMGAQSQIWISGIPMGDWVGKGGAGSPVDGRAATGDITADADVAYVMGTATTRWGSGVFMLASGTTVAAGTNLTVSGIEVGDFLGASAAVDFSAVAEDIIPDASGTRNIGTMANPWNSGFFNRMMVYSSANGSGWYLDVDANGVLQTTGPFQP